MKAVGYTRALPINEPESLIDTELPQPIARGRDLLVKVRAIAVNPVDYKIRQRIAPGEGETIGHRLGCRGPGSRDRRGGDPIQAR